MSRVTPPVNKFTISSIRRIHSSAQAARPSPLLDSHARNAVYLPRRLADLKTECKARDLKTTGSKFELVERLVAHDLTTRASHSTTAAHRPSISTQATYRFRPLMQGFRTSAVASAVHDNSTIDFMFLPEHPEEPPSNPFGELRIPLLPDNFEPDRSLHAVEEADTAIPRPEISIIASHPEIVVPSAMTEVVGNEALEGKIEDLTKAFKSTVEEIKQPGALREFFEGILDDVFGPKKKVMA